LIHTYVRTTCNLNFFELTDCRNSIWVDSDGARTRTRKIHEYELCCRNVLYESILPRSRYLEKNSLKPWDTLNPPP
jgi:hypothetical protein